MIKRSYEINDEAYSYFSQKAAEEDRPIIKYISRMLEQIAIDSQKATPKPRAKKYWLSIRPIKLKRRLIKFERCTRKKGIGKHR